MITDINSTDVNGTSFHEQTIRFTFNELKIALGEPDYTDFSGDKVSAEWSLTINGIPISIYDWKEYNRTPVNFQDTYFDWHIGSHSELPIECLVELREFIEDKILK